MYFGVSVKAAALPVLEAGHKSEYVQLSGIYDLLVSIRVALRLCKSPTAHHSKVVTLYVSN